MRFGIHLRSEGETVLFLLVHLISDHNCLFFKLVVELKNWIFCIHCVLHAQAKNKRVVEQCINIKSIWNQDTCKGSHVRDARELFQNASGCT